MAESTNTITGKIILIRDTEVISDKFQKREFVVEIPGQYPQSIPLQFSQKKCEVLDKYKVGQEVEVHYNLRGREYNGKYYATIEAWRITQASGTHVQPDANDHYGTGMSKDDSDLPF